MFSPFLSIPHHRPSHHPRPGRSSPVSQQLPVNTRPAPAPPPWGLLRYRVTPFILWAMSTQREVLVVVLMEVMQVMEVMEVMKVMQ